MDDKYYCEKCNATKASTEFYLSNNREKYPEGKEYEYLYETY